MYLTDRIDFGANFYPQSTKNIFSQLNQITMANKTFMPSAPVKTLWIVAVIIGFLGVLGHYTKIEVLSTYSYEMLLVGFVLLVIGTVYKGV